MRPSFKALARFAILLFLSACVADESGYNFVGAGYDLYTAETPKATRDLQAYFDALCIQAGIATVGGENDVGCPVGLTGAHYVTLMQAGFNDIDLRCDKYLGWIDRKRIEALSFGRGLGATEALIGAGLTASGAGADAFANVLAAFNFARSMYDASNLSLLAALETSTIKSIVYKRQKAFRTAANAYAAEQRGGVSRESVVFALRNYLLICTPQTIVLDANTFTRDPSMGSPDKLRSDFAEQFATLAPVTAATRIDAPTQVRPGVGADNCPSCKEVFLADDKKKRDLELVQERLCLPEKEVNGVYDSSTRLGLALFFQEITTFAGPKLSNVGYSQLLQVGCLETPSGGHLREIYKNFYEIHQYYDWQAAAPRTGTVVKLTKALNWIFPNDRVDPASVKSLADVRDLITKAGDLLKDQATAPSGQLSRGLDDAILARADEIRRKNQADGSGASPG